MLVLPACLGRPEGCHHFIGAAAEKKRADGPAQIPRVFAKLVIDVGPAELAPGIGDEPVERHEIGDDDFSHVPRFR
jgi:hypothetical protein